MTKKKKEQPGGLADISSKRKDPYDLKTWTPPAFEPAFGPDWKPPTKITGKEKHKGIDYKSVHKKKRRKK